MGKKLTALLLALVMTLSLVVSAVAVCYDQWSTEGTETMVNSVNGITTSTITSIFERNNTMSPNPDGTQHTESVTSRTDMDSAGNKQGWSYSKATADRDLLGNKTRMSVGYVMSIGGDNESLKYSVNLGEDTAETKNGVTITTTTDRYVQYVSDTGKPADMDAALQVTEWDMMSYGEEVSVTTDDPAKGYCCQESIAKTRNKTGSFTVTITGDAAKDGAFLQTATYSDLVGSKLETWTTGNEEGTQVREVMTTWHENTENPVGNYQRITTTERQISKDGLTERATSTQFTIVDTAQNGGDRLGAYPQNIYPRYTTVTRKVNPDGSVTVTTVMETATGYPTSQKTVTTKTTAKSGGKVTTKENSKNYQWSNGKWKLALERDNFNTRDAEGRVASSTTIGAAPDGSAYSRYTYNEAQNGTVQQLDDGWEQTKLTQSSINGDTMKDSKTESRTQSISVIKQHQTACKPEKVEGKAATEYSIGWKDYYQCPFCGDIFEDAKGTKPIEDLELWKMTDGKTTYNGSDWRTKLLKLGRIALSALALREFARCTLAVATLPYRSVTVMTTVARVLTAARLVQAWQHAIFH